MDNNNVNIVNFYIRLISNIVLTELCFTYLFEFVYLEIFQTGNRITLQNVSSKIAYKIEKVNLRREIFNDF
jgi:hypothetical protein